MNSLKKQFNYSLIIVSIVGIVAIVAISLMFIQNANYLRNNDIIGLASGYGSCIGGGFPNSVICSGDDTGLKYDSFAKLVSSCTSAKCEYICASGYTFSPASRDGDQGRNGGHYTSAKCVLSGASYSCTGSVPSNSQLCPGDDTDLASNTAISLVSSCTSTKCEYTCASGYTLKSGVCTLPAINYSCTGTIPSNSQLCSGDDTGLASNTAISLVSSCTSAKCEYTCASGYTLKSGVCVSSSKYSCTGSVPSNSQICSGDDTGLTSNTTRSLVSTCTSAKCEYTCASGYTLKSGVCIISSSKYSCTGSIPSNSQLCPDDDTGLTSNTTRSLVSTCTSAKCEYTCALYYILNNGTCVYDGLC
jgi:hypothetical protein